VWEGKGGGVARGKIEEGGIGGLFKAAISRRSKGRGPALRCHVEEGKGAAGWAHGGVAMGAGDHNA
jgi:hypothetical protein